MEFCLRENSTSGFGQGLFHLSIVGIAWHVLFFLYNAPRLSPDHWFEKGIGDMGQSMGVTVTGMLLLRMVDLRNETGAFESFAYKQLFFEPIVGGGLFTAAAALIVRFGLGGMLLITGGAAGVLAGHGRRPHAAAAQGSAPNVRKFCVVKAPNNKRYLLGGIKTAEVYRKG